jgi:hypothetical protein
MDEDAVCIFTTIRAPLNDTLAFVNYHINIGIDHIYLFFDDPDDQAVDVLSPDKRITCYRCNAGYWADKANDLPKSDLSINVKQEINSRVAINISREKGYKWICHLDGDELIYAPGGFKKTIASLKPYVQVARFPVLEAIPDKITTQSAFQDLYFFKHGPINCLPKNGSIYMDRRQFFFFLADKIQYNAKKIRSILLGCNQVTDGYIKGHTAGKSITRINTFLVSYSSHFPILAEKERLPVTLVRGIKLLHFDSPDYDRWKSKWYGRYMNMQNGITPVQLSVHRRRQFEQFIKVYEGGNEEDLVTLFTKTFFIPASDRIILQKTGLVSEIHLPAEFFSPPPDLVPSEMTNG